MEGPSLLLAAQQLSPFIGQQILDVNGNTKSPQKRFRGAEVKDIFSWGKHLVFQFDTFALRIHFLMFGSFEATVNDRSVTGIPKKKVRTPRLAFTFKNGHVELYSCSVKVIESTEARRAYDFKIDLMSPSWDAREVLKRLRRHPNDEIADALLDQEIFAGLGNMIKNEILFLAHVRPVTRVGDLPAAKLRSLVQFARRFSQQFYDWRKEFVLLKNLRVHRKHRCPTCGGPLIRAKTGQRDRWSYYCPIDQVS